jgi:TPR repeat protein
LRAEKMDLGATSADEVLLRLLEAARADDVDATANRGAAYLRRGADVEAEPWLRRAAEAGEPHAAYNLATCRERAGDLTEALERFRRAAELGDPDAPFHVKRLLDAGKGSQS